jgi:DNA-binding response OmpR family regulator
MSTELKVLLLEDNPGDAFLIKFYLSESSSPLFNVMHAETVKGALDLLAENKFDIIVSDMNLPDSFGVETIKTILSKYPGNMLIVLTGLTDEEVGLETVRFGAQDFLVKGKFDGKVLISSVMFAFERFKLNKQLDEENSRLDNLQRVLKVGYFEIDTRTNQMFRTNYILELLGLEKDTKFNDFFETISLLEDAAKLKETYHNIVANKLSGECNFKGSHGKQFKATYQCQEGRICGVIQPL